MFEEILSRIARALDRHSLPYMIIGGQAVLLYGEPRLTRDIDVTLGIAADGLPVLLSAVGEAGFTPLPDDVPAFVEKTMVLPVIDDPTGIRVDFILSFTPYEQEAIGRARTVNIGDTNVRFASVEDLIIHKIFAGRPRDLEDVRSILLRNRDVDREYITFRLEQFDTALADSEGRRFADRFKEVSGEIG